MTWDETEGDDPSSPVLGDGVLWEAMGMRVAFAKGMPSCTYLLTMEAFVWAAFTNHDISSSRAIRRRLLCWVEGDPNYDFRRLGDDGLQSLTLFHRGFRKVSSALAVLARDPTP